MLDHLRMAGRPRWLAFTGFALLMLVIFLLLGQWQLNRASSTARADQLRASASAAEVVDVSEVLSQAPPDRTVEWRAVRASGVYDAEGQLLVRNRSLNSVNGYWVLVPLRTDSGPDLLVVRGWVPSGPTATAPASLPSVPPGRVTVQGRVRLAEPSAGPSDLPAGQIERIVPEEIATATGRPTYPGFLALETENPPTPEAADVKRLPSGASGGWSWPISHTVYAFQWFTFAVIAAVGWFILLRRDVRAEVDAQPSEETIN